MVLGGGILTVMQPSTSGEQGPSGFDQMYLEDEQHRLRTYISTLLVRP